MKKLSILLVLVLLLGALAGCKNNGTPDTQIPGYQISLVLGDSWTEVEKPDDTNLEEGEMPIISRYDLEMENKGMKLLVLGFSPYDFVDLPLADELFTDCTETLLATLTETSEIAAANSYKSGDKQIISAMYSGKESGEAKQVYCFMVDFGEDTYCQVWLAFIAKEADMNKNKDAFKAIAESAVCSADPYDFESGLDDELYFDEDGNLITDETGAEEEYYDETEAIPTGEVNPPEPTYETTPPVIVETTGEASETTAPTADATTAPTGDTTATETPAAAETTAPTQAQ